MSLTYSPLPYFEQFPDYFSSFIPNYLSTMDATSTGPEVPPTTTVATSLATPAPSVSSPVSTLPSALAEAPPTQAFEKPKQTRKRKRKASDDTPLTAPRVKRQAPSHSQSQGSSHSREYVNPLGYGSRGPYSASSSSVPRTMTYHPHEYPPGSSGTHTASPYSATTPRRPGQPPDFYQQSTVPTVVPQPITESYYYSPNYTQGQTPSLVQAQPIGVPPTHPPYPVMSQAPTYSPVSQAPPVGAPYSPPYAFQQPPPPQQQPQPQPQPPPYTPYSPPSRYPSGYSQTYPGLSPTGLSVQYGQSSAGTGVAVGQAVEPQAGEEVPRRKAPPQCFEHGCNGRTFSTFSNLLRHQRERNGTALKSYCHRCGAEFTRTTARNGHVAHAKCGPKNRTDEQ